MTINDEPRAYIQYAGALTKMNESESSNVATSLIVRTPEGVQDLSGQKFGKWTVLYYSHKRLRKGQSAMHYWWCQCSCRSNTIRPTAQLYLQNGESKSCGCYRGEAPTKHGMSWGKNKHRLYGTWSSMMFRCNSPKNSRYKYYGGRGIKVDASWRNFAVFADDMSPSWVEGMTLDRIDNDGPYSKKNCRWANKSDQMNNTRANRFVVYHGERITAAQLMRRSKHKISYGTICSRLDAGWSPEDTAETPISKTHSRSNSARFTSPPTP